MNRTEYLRHMAIFRSTLDKLERDLAGVCELPPAARAIVMDEVAKARCELDLSDLRVGVRPPFNVVKA